MPKSGRRAVKAVVVGVSTGGVAALKLLLGALPKLLPVPVMVVTHLAPGSDDGLAVLLDTYSALRVKEADDQEALQSGVVYVAPANYHLLVGRDLRLALTVDPLVNFARPSVDILFETAAAAYGDGLIGVLLTGAGFDGSKGLLKIRQNGGVTVVQDPADAECDAMPKSALQLLHPDYVKPLKQIPAVLMKLVSSGLSHRKHEHISQENA